MAILSTPPPRRHILAESPRASASALFIPHHHLCFKRRGGPVLPRLGWSVQNPISRSTIQTHEFTENRLSRGSIHPQPAVALHGGPHTVRVSYHHAAAASKFKLPPRLVVKLGCDRRGGFKEEYVSPYYSLEAKQDSPLSRQVRREHRDGRQNRNEPHQNQLNHHFPFTKTYPLLLPEQQWHRPSASTITA